MKTCPYCGSLVELICSQFQCNYCELTLYPEDVQEDGDRKDFLPVSQPSYTELRKSTSELMELTTIELLYLLKFARAERRGIYANRKVFIQALKEGVEECVEGIRYTFNEYEYWTRKCFVLENLIRERMGYIPEKISDSYLDEIITKMKESQQKVMMISAGKSIVAGQKLTDYKRT
ncbi:hypothetical protein [Mesobacillus foraminis]|uniref:Uncharacterized protein n=1 Tax=Mesobacillus foraminis TaxID=279826 RepID=A0A4R2AYV9_9BACI|nr:hypothetical protein [Mesobacillus foraminis]TCN18404.1 hypothetical protein EV146_1202 [Mesobacillus foraminis]